MRKTPTLDNIEGNQRLFLTQPILQPIILNAALSNLGWCGNIFGDKNTTTNRIINFFVLNYLITAASQKA